MMPGWQAPLPATESYNLIQMDHLWFPSLINELKQLTLDEGKLILTELGELPPILETTKFTFISE